MKYLQNKYSTLYFNIIENRLATPLLDSYTEKHHIIPDSMGGSDNNFNRVNLSAREHFLCHYLLTKMLVPYSDNWFKMNKAFMMMKSSSSNQQRYFNSHLYESKRKDFSITQSHNQSGKKNSQYNTCWIHLDKVNKKIKIKELEKFYSNGWKKGKYKIKEVCCHWCKNIFDTSQSIRPERNYFCSELPRPKGRGFPLGQVKKLNQNNKLFQ